MVFLQPIPREKTSKRRAPAKKQVKPMGKVAAQKKRDDNRKSAQQLAHQVSHFLKCGKVSNVASIDEAIDSVRSLFHRIQLIKVQHLTTVAVQSAARPKPRKR
jgi:hypothetical protein